MTASYQQGSPEWLEMRKSHIGASDAPIIMGVSPFKRNGRFKTPYLLWQEKLDLLPPEKENAAMRFGKDNEEKARQEYEKMTGEIVYPHICFHKEKSYMMASLDGINFTHDMIVEIKNAGQEDHEEARRKKIPSHYYPQVQHQLACSNLNHMHYFSFNQGEGLIVEVKRDDIYLEEMYEKEEKFWDNICNFKPPELTDKDFRERDEIWEEAATKLWSIKQQKKEIAAREKEQEKLLKELSEGQSSFSGNFRYLLSPAKGAINYSAIPELENVNLESYRKAPIQKWYLSSSK